MYIKRKLESTILQYLNAPEIIAIIGPRQSGKTTMLQNIFKDLPNAIQISFDDRTALNMFERDIDGFVANYVKEAKYLLIDEFQYAKDGGKILKYIFDKWKFKIFVSGSSAIDLTVQALKYLVGRILIFNLYQFDFEEFLRAKGEQALAAELDSVRGLEAEKLKKYYEEYLIFGGYPRVALESDPESRKVLLGNIYSTYFLREVKDVLGLIDDYGLGILVKALAAQIGNLLEYSELSRLSGFSFPTLKKYLNFLEKTYICKFVRPFFRNKRIEIVKNPKVYFFDTGLRNAILGEWGDLSARQDKGALLENGLAMQFIKRNQDFHFWRDKKRHEIDFVLDLPDGKKMAVESKYQSSGADKKCLSSFESKYPEIPTRVSCFECDTDVQSSVSPVYSF